MKRLKYAYCNECEDLVEFDTIEKEITEIYEEKKFVFDLKLAVANLAEVKLLQIRNIMIEDLKPRLKLIKK